jgi:hypothetical protein
MAALNEQAKERKIFVSLLLFCFSLFSLCLIVLSRPCDGGGDG